MDVLVGLDIGTTSVKAQVFHPDGRPLAVASIATPWQRVPTGAQAEADTLVDAARTVARQALDEIAESAGATPRPLGVGVTGLAESGVLVRPDGSPVAPVTAWYDTRGIERVPDLAAALEPDTFSRITGLPLSDRPSVIKLRWLADQGLTFEPGMRWMSVPEWVVYRLGGAPCTEASQASRTGLLDVLEGTAHEELRGWCGAPPSILGELVPAGTSVGIVPESVPELAGAHLTAAGMDHIVAVTGVGATGDTDLLDSCGTGEALVRKVAHPPTRDLLAQAVEQGFSMGRDHDTVGYRMIGGLRSGIGMWRFLKLMGLSGEDIPWLDDAALAHEPGPDSPRIEEIWMERAALVNVPYEPDHGAIWRAAVDAAQERALVLRQRGEQLLGPVERVVAIGGGLRSRAVRERKAAILGPFEHPDVDEGGCRGAALLAGQATGLIDDPGRVAPPGSAAA